MGTRRRRCFQRPALDENKMGNHPHVLCLYRCVAAAASGRFRTSSRHPTCWGRSALSRRAAHRRISDIVYSGRHKGAWGVEQDPDLRHWTAGKTRYWMRVAVIDAPCFCRASGVRLSTCI